MAGTTAYVLAADCADVPLATRRAERLESVTDEIEAATDVVALVVSTDVTDEQVDAMVGATIDAFGALGLRRRSRTFGGSHGPIDGFCPGSSSDAFAAATCSFAGMPETIESTAVSSVPRTPNRTRRSRGGPWKTPVVWAVSASLSSVSASCRVRFRNDGGIADVSRSRCP
jgi:hypothetical protein